jgi:hypothetical protein
VKERIVLWMKAKREKMILAKIHRLLKKVPHYDIAYRENIATEGKRVYKARKRRKDARNRVPIYP